MRAQEFEREIWLRADPSSASVARAFAGEAAQDVGCDRAGTEAIRLGITEAVANAVEHGTPCDTGTVAPGLEGLTRRERWTSWTSWTQRSVLRAVPRAFKGA